MSPKLVALAAAWILFCGAAHAGVYVHTATGFEFPEKVAAFARTQITPSADEKNDVEIDYQNTPFTVRASVYVYPAGSSSLSEHFQACCDAVVKATPKASQLSQGPTTLTKSGVTYHGFVAVYSFHEKFVGGKDQDLLSRVILFRRGAYYVLYRISYAKSDQAAAEKQIADFTEALAWPPGGTDGPSGTD